MHTKTHAHVPTFSTDLTDEGPGACMYRHVTGQVVVRVEHLSTLEAGERLVGLSSCGGRGEAGGGGGGGQSGGGQPWGRRGTRLLTSRSTKK